jgi:hypothetical protein
MSTNLESKVLEVENVGETYASMQMLRDKKLKIYRIFYDKDVDKSFFNNVTNNDTDIKSECFFKCEANWVNSTRESGYFYEMLANGDSTLVNILFEEFLVKNKIEAQIELSPANLVTDANEYSKHFEDNVPELYYFENELEGIPNGNLYKGIPFLLSINIVDTNIEEFSIDDILPKHDKLGWWTDSAISDDLDINVEEKTVNGKKFSEINKIN